MSTETLQYPAKIANEIGLGVNDLMVLKSFGCPFYGRKTSIAWVQTFLSRPSSKCPLNTDSVSHWKDLLTKRRRDAEKVRKRYRSHIPRTTRQFVLVRDSALCRYCGFLANQIDHVIPVIKGGGHGADNLVVVCKPCNSRKRDKTLEEFLAK